ncbi:MAG: type VI secretion system baseplate subunit TssG, partial [Thermodesulfobacteriota bacterium]
MAGEDRGSSLNLKLDLLEKGHEFSFFQALRLLRRLTKGIEQPSPEGRGHIKIRPHLSLAFPPADIAQIEENAEDPFSFTVTATFLGLYGSSSPLPTFYTEDLLAEAMEEETVTRDFIDIFNQ